MNPGSEILRVRLQRDEHQPWGFRLQGGADFAVPLSIQLVNPGSIAERYNVHPGDAVLAINEKDTSTLDHEAAKYEILMAQNELQLVLQRGAVSIWKPKVTPLSELKPSELRTIPGTEGDVYVQRTSLAADKREPLKIGSYNRTARPFGGFGSGSSPAPAPEPVSSQHHSTMPPQQQGYEAPPPPPPQAQPYQYGGASQAQYDAYQAQQMAISQQQAGGYGGGYQNQPIEPTQAAPAFAAPPPPPAAVQPQQPQGGNVQGMRSVRAPVTKPPSERPQQQHPTCGVCGGLIVGVFVKISGEPLHPECFKCTRCGKNLKNQGHFTVEGKRYCDTCASQVAEPPGPDMVATPVYR